MSALAEAHTRAEPQQSSRRARFEALFTSESRALLGYAWRRVSNAEDAADIVAETFLVAWRRIDDVPAGRDGRLWLYGVARRVCANHTRSTGRRHRLAERLKEHLFVTADLDRGDSMETTALVREALQRLDAADRELLQLSAWEGLSPAELGTVLSASPGTVRSRLFRARKRLRAELEAMGWPGERTTGSGHVPGDGQMLVRRKEEL